MESKYVNPDLKREREAYPSNSEALSVAIYGKDLFPKLTRLQQIFAKNDKFDLKHTWSCDSTTRYLKACQIGEELAQLIREHNLMEDEALVGALQVMVGEDMFLLLHLTMFLCTLEAMCNDEQVRPQSLKQQQQQWQQLNSTISMSAGSSPNCVNAGTSITAAAAAARCQQHPSVFDKYE
ncbi:hypothetical protein Emed_006876 [Eimeria media]